MHADGIALIGVLLALTTDQSDSEAAKCTESSSSMPTEFGRAALDQ